MKTDTIFYRLFQSFPEILLELVGKSAEVVASYQFASVEVKQLAFRIDGVFLPQNEEVDLPIYFTEVQFQADHQFYSRFFSEIFLYLHQTNLSNDWRGLIIFPKRQLDTGETTRYRELIDSGRVTKIYLEELDNQERPSLGVSILKLIIASESEAISQGKELIERIRIEVNVEVKQQALLELVETILVYKLPGMSYQEIEAMFTLSDLKKTKVYQQGKEEGKLESIPRLWRLGLTVEQIAEALDVEIETVRKAIDN